MSATIDRDDSLQTSIHTSETRQLLFVARQIGIGYIARRTAPSVQASACYDTGMLVTGFPRTLNLGTLAAAGRRRHLMPRLIRAYFNDILIQSSPPPSTLSIKLAKEYNDSPLSVLLT